MIREVQKQIKSVTFDEDGKAIITYSDDNRTIAFDETVYPVTVDVVKIVSEDGASETLTATVYYAAEVPGEGSEPGAGKTPPQFKNTTRPGSLQISKVGKGLTEANKDAEFTFKVTLSNDAGMPLTESGNMFWYAEESEEKTTPAPIPPQPNQPENAEPKAVNAPAAPAGGRTLREVQKKLLSAPVKAPTAGTVTASGVFNDTYKDVKWTLYSDGLLIIEPVNGVSGTILGTNEKYDGNSEALKIWPWNSYRSSIKSVQVKGRVEVVRGLRCMFENCSNLTYADLSGLYTDPNNIAIAQIFCTSFIFSGCKVEYLDVSNMVVTSSMYNGDQYAALDFRTLTSLKCIRFGSSFYKVSEMSSSLTGWKNLDTGTVISGTLNGLSDASLAGTWVRGNYNPNYTIEFYPNGATGTMESIVAELLKNPTLPKCTFESDLIFIGWSADPNSIVPEYADGAEYTGTATPNGVVKLYAIWMSEDNFLLNYDANGGYSRVQWQRVNGPTDTVSMPIPTHPNNYEFLYWSTNQDGSGNRYSGTVSGADFNAAPGATIKLYAQFADPSKRAPITVKHYQQNTDLETYSLYESIRIGAYEFGSEETIPNDDYVKRVYKGFVTPNEFKLDGSEDWQADGSSVTVVKGGVTVCYYYNRTHYTITFDANGGEGTMDSMSMTGGVPAKLPTNRFTNGDAVFVGWNTVPKPDKENPGKNYGDGQSVNSIGENNQVVTLYAQWYDLDDAEQAKPTNGEYTVHCKANETIVFPSLPAGTHYQITEVDLPDGWTLASIKPDSGTILSAERIDVTAINRYSAVGYADIMAHKALPGGTLNEGKFSFQLLDENDKVLQTVSNSMVDSMEQAFDSEGNPIANKYYGTAPVVFQTLSFNQQDVYHYKIKEVAGEDGSIEYDEHVENVTIYVTDGGNGRLNTQVIYDASGADFRNTMSDGSLKVSKTIRNATEQAADKRFSFTVYLFTSEGSEIIDEFPVTLSNGEGTTVRSGGSVQIKGGEWFRVDKLPYDTHYLVDEKPADGFELVSKENYEGTIQAGDTIEATFENAYSSRTDRPNGIGAEIKAKKNLVGGSIKQEQFQFRLLDSQGEVLETVFADPSGEVKFSAIHYDLNDDGQRFVYFIEEVIPEDLDPTIIYDTHRERVTVTVTDNGDGTMTASVEYNGETQEEKQQPPVFTNKKKTGKLQIVKSLTNFEGTEPATFVFDIKAVAGKDAEGNDIVVYSNAASITLNGPGTGSVLVEGIPIDAVVTVTEIYSGAKYKQVAEPEYLPEDQKIVALDSPESPLTVTFSNTYDGSGKGGHGIQNHFTAGADGSYAWTQGDGSSVPLPEVN